MSAERRRLAMSKSNRIKSLLSDEDFLSVIADERQALTKKVMSKSTSPEDALHARTECHALDSLISRMRSEAQNAKE